MPTISACASRTVTAVAALALAAFTAPAHAQYLFTKIADNSTPTPNGGNYSGFFNPAISGNNVAFLGNYSGGTGTSGIFRSDGLTTTSVARGSFLGDSSGDATPNGGNFTGFTAPAISGNNVAFRGSYSGGTGTNGIFRNDGTTTTGIVNNTTATPNGGTFTNFFNTAVSGNNVAFRGNYTGGTGTNGIFRNDGTTTTSIARGGNGSNLGETTPYGGTFTGFSSVAVSGNNTAFRGSITGGGGVDGIFRNDGTTTTGIARGSSVTDPGSATPNGGTFTSLGAPAISGNNIAFISNYAGGTGVRGLFRHDGTTITSIVYHGTIPSEDPQIPGGTLTAFLGDAAISGDTIAFRANYDGPTSNSIGIFTVTDGVFTKVIGESESIFGGYVDGSVPDALDFAPSGLDGKNIAFRYNFNEGTRGIGLATHISPTVGITVAPGITPLLKQHFTQTAGSSVINGNLTIEDDFQPNGRETLTIAGGTLSGAGTITGNVAITGGTFAPGNSPSTLLSPGTFTVDGVYRQSGGVFAVELASGTLFDVLNADGAVEFTGGSFSVSTLGGFTPTVGQFFDIVTTTGGITGFGTVFVPSGYTFTPSGNNGRLTFVGGGVVPEPGAGLLALVGAGYAMLGVAIRRRK